MIICSLLGSKHAVEGLAKCLRYELRPWNIHVCNINPAFMKTPILTSGNDASTLEFQQSPIKHHYPADIVSRSAEFMFKAPEVCTLFYYSIFKLCDVLMCVFVFCSFRILLLW